MRKVRVREAQERKKKKKNPQSTVSLRREVRLIVTFEGKIDCYGKTLYHKCN